MTLGMNFGLYCDLAYSNISDTYARFSSSVEKKIQPLCSAVTQGYEAVANIVENVAVQAKELISNLFSKNVSIKPIVETRDASTQTGFNREVTCIPFGNSGNLSIIIEKSGVCPDLIVYPQGSLESAVKYAIGSDKKMHIEFQRQGGSSVDFEFDLEIDGSQYLVKISGREKYFSSYDELLKFVAGNFKSCNQEFCLLVKTY